MADEPIPQPVPVPQIPNGNGWKRKALGKLAENPIGFLDWACKVGVSTAIGLYLVVRLTNAMGEYLAIQGKEAIKQTKQITEMVLTTKEVSLTQDTIKDLSKTAQESAKAAQEAASIAAKGMAAQKPLLETMAKDGKERTRIMADILVEHKRFLPVMEKMDRSASEERKMFWERSEKHDNDVLDNQKRIMERLPQPTKPPGKP